MLDTSNWGSGTRASDEETHRAKAEGKTVLLPEVRRRFREYKTSQNKCYPGVYQGANLPPSCHYRVGNQETASDPKNTLLERRLLSSFMPHKKLLAPSVFCVSTSEHVKYLEGSAWHTARCCIYTCRIFISMHLSDHVCICISFLIDMRVKAELCEAVEWEAASVHNG